MSVTRQEYFDRWSVLHGGYDPSTSFLVGTWLGLVHVLARPFVALRVPPGAVTVLGGVVAALAIWPAWIGGRWCLVAFGVVLLSGVVDNLDGAVAVMTDRTSAWGAVLDSVVDRVADACYLVVLWVVGAPAGACILAGALMGLQEYTRARATASGMDDVGVITVWERPTRVIVTAMFLLGAGVYVGAASTWVTVAVWLWVVLGAIGLTQLLVVVRRRLRDDS